MRLPSAFALAAVTIVALVASECANEPNASAPPSVSIPTATEPGRLVVGKAPPAAGGLPAIIVLEPEAPRDFPVPTELKVMDQYGYAFVPGLLLARKGQSVRFENSEDVLHNVRVVETATGSTAFNVATVPTASYNHIFERAGFYSVHCDVHQDMYADILVTSTPYAVVADDDGNFTLSDVGPGRYKLTVYVGARRIERLVEVAGSPTELVVEEQ